MFHIVSDEASSNHDTLCTTMSTYSMYSMFRCVYLERTGKMIPQERKTVTVRMNSELMIEVKKEIKGESRVCGAQRNRNRDWSSRNSSLSFLFSFPFPLELFQNHCQNSFSFPFLVLILHYPLYEEIGNLLIANSLSPQSEEFKLSD